MTSSVSARLRDAGLDNSGVLSEYPRDSVKELETRLGEHVSDTSAGQSSSSSCNSSFTPLLDSRVISGSSRTASLRGGLVGDTITGGDPRTDHATCFLGSDLKTDHASFSAPGGDPRTDHEASESASFVVGECDESVGMAATCPPYRPGRLATDTAYSIPSALASDCFSAADVFDARPVLRDGFSAISASPVLRDGFPTTSEHPGGFTHEKNPTFSQSFDAAHRDGLSLRLADRLLIRKYGSDMEDSGFRNFTDIAALLRVDEKSGAEMKFHSKSSKLRPHGYYANGCGTSGA